MDDFSSLTRINSPLSPDFKCQFLFVFPISQIVCRLWLLSAKVSYSEYHPFKDSDNFKHINFKAAPAQTSFLSQIECTVAEYLSG